MKRKMMVMVLAAAMSIAITACGSTSASKTETKEPETTEQTQETAQADSNAAENAEGTESAQASETTPNADAGQSTETVADQQATEETAADPNAIRPEVQEAIDSYSAFIDQYCEFMKNANYSDPTWMAQYTEYMNKLTDMETKFNSIKDMQLNTAEENYYIKVMNDCNTKMMQTANSMQ